jgi:hypothetical protein
VTGHAALPARVSGVRLAGLVADGGAADSVTETVFVRRIGAVRSFIGGFSEPISPTGESRVQTV